MLHPKDSNTKSSSKKKTKKKGLSENRAALFDNIELILNLFFWSFSFCSADNCFVF